MADTIVWLSQSGSLKLLVVCSFLVLVAVSRPHLKVKRSSPHSFLSTSKLRKVRIRQAIRCACRRLVVDALVT